MVLQPAKLQIVGVLRGFAPKSREGLEGSEASLP